MSRNMCKLCVKLRNANIYPLEFQISKNDCKHMEDSMIKTETAEMDKMRRIRAEDWGLKENGNLWSVQQTWGVLHVAGNYSHSRRYKATGWRCQACVSQVREDQDHMGLCQGYSDLRQGLDLDRDDDMVEFFRLVMTRREQQGWD